MSKSANQNQPEMNDIEFQSHIIQDALDIAAYVRAIDRSVALIEGEIDREIEAEVKPLLRRITNLTEQLEELSAHMAEKFQMVIAGKLPTN